MRRFIDRLFVRFRLCHEKEIMNRPRMRGGPARASRDISGFVREITYGKDVQVKNGEVPARLSYFLRQTSLLQECHGLSRKSAASTERRNPNTRLNVGRVYIPVVFFLQIS